MEPSSEKDALQLRAIRVPVVEPTRSMKDPGCDSSTRLMSSYIPTPHPVKFKAYFSNSLPLARQSSPHAAPSNTKARLSKSEHCPRTHARQLSHAASANTRHSKSSTGICRSSPLSSHPVHLHEESHKPPPLPKACNTNSLSPGSTFVSSTHGPSCSRDENAVLAASTKLRSSFETPCQPSPNRSTFNESLESCATPSSVAFLDSTTHRDSFDTFSSRSVASSMSLSSCRAGSLKHEPFVLAGVSPIPCSKQKAVPLHSTGAEHELDHFTEMGDHSTNECSQSSARTHTTTTFGGEAAQPSATAKGGDSSTRQRARAEPSGHSGSSCPCIRNEDTLSSSRTFSVLSSLDSSLPSDSGEPSSPISAQTFRSPDITNVRSLAAQRCLRNTHSSSAVTTPVVGSGVLDQLEASVLTKADAQRSCAQTDRRPPSRSKKEQVLLLLRCIFVPFYK